jgi:hypothetical protein
MKVREWTYMDEEKLRTLYQSCTCEEIARKLGRTVRATFVKAQRMGLKKHHHGTEWTPRMLKLLNDFFPIMFNKPLAQWIGVSPRTLIRKARQLGLEKRPGFLEDRRHDIAKLASEGLKRCGNVPSRFPKGVRSNPAGEFKKGHVESPETKAKRSEAMRRYWRYRKQKEEIRKHGINI